VLPGFLPFRLQFGHHPDRDSWVAPRPGPDPPEATVALGPAGPMTSGSDKGPE